MTIYISGIGIISAIGNNISECTEALLNGQSGIKKSKYKDRSGNHLPAGEVNLSNKQLCALLRINESEQFSRATLMSIIAGREAYGTSKKTEGIREGLIGSYSLNSLDLITELKLNSNELNIEKHGVVLSQYSGSFISDAMSNYLNINGFVSSLSTACSSSANAIMLGARMIEHGLLDRVLVGGVDSLNVYGVSGFKSLHVYDNNVCRPFDQNRNGMNLGEGSGFILLENKKALGLSKNKILAKLVGWSNTNDAYHQTAAKEGGMAAAKSMKNALIKAKINPSQIDYINAHGTGTKNNDLIESQAILNVFGDQTPSFSSTKSLTGHTLGAAGGIEAVLSVLSILEQKAWSNNEWATPMDETQLTPVVSPKNQPIQFVISNSFGFGGSNSTLIFSK